MGRVVFVRTILQDAEVLIMKKLLAFLLFLSFLLNCYLFGLNWYNATVSDFWLKEFIIYAENKDGKYEANRYLDSLTRIPLKKTFP